MTKQQIKKTYIPFMESMEHYNRTPYEILRTEIDRAAKTYDIPPQEFSAEFKLSYFKSDDSWIFEANVIYEGDLEKLDVWKN